MIVQKIETEEDWLKARTPMLTASEAGRYCGVDHWMVNSQYHYWEEKTGRRLREDISSKPAVVFGKKAEEHVRALYALMEGVDIEYHPFWMYSPDEMPWMGATLDGIIHCDDGGDEIYEGKTSTIRNYRMHFNEDVPDNYLCQQCHQLICYPKARASRLVVFYYDKDSDKIAGMAVYRYTREELEENIRFVKDRAVWMHGLIENNTPPPMRTGGLEWRVS